MEPARSQVLKGLIEGLALHAIDEEPTHGYGLLKQLENALGERPSKNRVYPLLRDLEEDGLIESEEVDDARTKQVYHLTDAGRERLGSFRNLPRPFKRWLAGLFAIDASTAEPAAMLEPDEDREPAREPEPEPEQAPARDVDELPADRAWVPATLAGLPAGPPVQAPHARISLDRAPGEGSWTFTVERHQPGEYEDADRCPLTFLYLAVQRLCFQSEL